MRNHFRIRLIPIQPHLDRFVTSEERDEFLEAFVERAILIEIYDL